MGQMLIRVAEVTQSGRITTIKVVAESNIEARGLVVRHLGEEPWERIRVRDTPDESKGPPRILADGD